VFNYLSLVWQNLLKYLSDPGKLFIGLISAAANAVRVESCFGMTGARSTRSGDSRRRMSAFDFSRVCLIAPGKFVGNVCASVGRTALKSSRSSWARFL
jgi:hypothetical protein